MAKGVAIKFVSYEETVPKVLKAIKFDQELAKHQRIVIKPNLIEFEDHFTPLDFTEALVKFCAQHKAPGSEIFIAEGCDGEDTMDRFTLKGYRTLAEKYGVALVDLNKTECDELGDNKFLAFDTIMYPRLLRESFVISLPKLAKHDRHEIMGSLANMRGAFPAKYYRGMFSSTKNKLKGPVKYQIHDIIRCKLPQFALIDAREQGYLFAGMPLDMDKQAAKLLGMDWRNVAHLRVIDESLAQDAMEKAKSAESTVA